MALLASSARKNCPENVIFKKIELPEWVRADVYLATNKRETKNKLIIEVYDCILEILHGAHKF